MSDCRFGVSPVNYPDPDPDAFIMQMLPPAPIWKGSKKTVAPKIGSVSV